MVGKKNLRPKFWDWLLLKWHQNYMGACFQAPCYCTQTITGGNALCLLISFVFQHVTSTRSYKVMYQQCESLQYKLDKEINYMCKSLVLKILNMSSITP